MQDRLRALASISLNCGAAVIEHGAAANLVSKPGTRRLIEVYDWTCL